MSFSTIETRLDAATTVAELASAILHAVSNGPADGEDSEVPTESGAVKTLARVIAELSASGFPAALADSINEDYGSALVGHQGDTVQGWLNRVFGMVTGVTILVPEFWVNPVYEMTQEDMTNQVIIVLNPAEVAGATLRVNMAGGPYPVIRVVNFSTQTVAVVSYLGEEEGDPLRVLPGAREHVGFSSLVDGAFVAGDAPLGLGYQVVVPVSDAGEDVVTTVDYPELSAAKIVVVDTGDGLDGPHTLEFVGNAVIGLAMVARPVVANHTSHRLTVRSAGGSVDTVVPPGRELFFCADLTEQEILRCPIGQPLKPVNISAPSDVDPEVVAVAEHADAWVRGTGADPIEYLVSGGVQSPWMVGDTVNLRLAGAPSLEVIEGTLCTVNGEAGKGLTLSAAGATATLVCVEFNEGTGAVVWDAVGAFAEV